MCVHAGQVATGACLWHTCPGDLSPGGEVAIVYWAADGSQEIMTVSGQGTMPAAATLEKYAELGIKHPQSMPGSGLLAACVPGAFDAWMLLLATRGTMRPRQVLEAFIDYCLEGVPVKEDVHNSLGYMSQRFVEQWPSSAEAFGLDAEGRPPPMGGLFKNKIMGAAFERLCSEAEQRAAEGMPAPVDAEARRQAEIAAIRSVWSTGFVAEAVVAHCKSSFKNERATPPRMDSGLITMADMAGYAARVEPALTYDYHGWTVGKCGPWSQGPVFLQQLALLKG